MSESKDVNAIDLRQVFKQIAARKMLFVKVLPVVFVLSCFYIICIPRTYTTTCRLAPEANSSSGGGTLSALASNFGIDIAEMNTSDAITPMLYPDLMEDNMFVVNLFPIRVKTADGSLRTSYKDYLQNHQKAAWWVYCITWLKNLLASDEETEDGDSGEAYSPYILGKGDDDLCKAIRTNVNLDIDKKTGVISITVSDQDPLVCKTIADSVSTHLQQFVIEYRTNKARTDLEFYRELTNNAKHEYDSVRRRYNALVDANRNVVLQRYMSRQDDLESELQLKFSNYSSLNAILQQAVSKVQERTPVFTVLKGAEVPLKPAKPKRMIFVLGMTVLAAVCVAIYILKDILKS